MKYNSRDQYQHDLNRMNIFFAGDVDSDYIFVEIYYDDKYFGRMRKDKKSNEYVIDFSGRNLDRINEIKITTMKFLLQIAIEVYNGDAYFDCGFYTKANKTE